MSQQKAQLSEVTFRCRCKFTFKARPENIVPLDDEQDDGSVHPFEYFATCPDCGETAKQAHWERNLLKAWANSTGPTTAEGKRRVRENLIGHPTADETLRTRFNAMKHGLNARVATYFPANPDGYAFCAGCSVDRDACRKEPCCVKQTELFMRHRAAFEQKNPKLLQGIQADFHAALMATLSECLRKIIGDGVMFSTPKTYVTSEGVCLVAQYIDTQTGKLETIMEVQAHPLFKPVAELLSRIGLSLKDLAMTPQAVGDDDTPMGRLNGDGDNRQALADYAQRKAKSLEDLQGMMQRSRQKSDADPVLLEYKQQNGGN